MPAVETQPAKTTQPQNPHGNNGGDGAPKGQTHEHGEHDLPKDLPRPSTFTVIVMLCIFLAVLAALFVVGLIPHEHAKHVAQSDASERGNATPTVQVVAPKPSGKSRDLTFPCDVRANQSTDLYPRSNGFLKKLYVDIQDHAEADQLLAEIDTPEIDAELAQSQANLVQGQANVGKARSDLDLAIKTLNRYLETQKSSPGSVTDQEIDQNKSAVDDAKSALDQANAAVLSDQANVQQLTVTQGFEKIYAPFSGTITARNYDLGALLSPTTTGDGKQLFSIAQTDPLRVFVNVPQNDATPIKTGQPATLEVSNYPARKFQGFVARTSGALDPTTRTLEVEIHFPNKENTLFVGMYGQVHLQIEASSPVLTIPSSALVFNANGLKVATVKDGKIHMQPVKVGRDLGTELEITTGLSDQDQVVTNPGERLAEGTTVKVPPVAQADAAAK